MKALTTIILLSITLVSNSQIEMFIDGGTTDVSGTEIYLDATSTATIVSDIHIHNSSGLTKDWVVTRLRINEQSSWTDYLCYGHETDVFGGICYGDFVMDYTSWTTPTSIVANDGETVILQSDIIPADITTPVTVTYRYYIGTQNDLYEDSIDIIVSTPLSVDELTNNKKDVIGYFDLMGRRTEYKENTPLIYLYSDGTREKVLRIKY